MVTASQQVVQLTDTRRDSQGVKDPCDQGREQEMQHGKESPSSCQRKRVQSYMDSHDS